MNSNFGRLSSSNAVLIKIGSQTYKDTYKKQFNEDVIKRMISEIFNENKLNNQILDNNISYYLVYNDIYTLVAYFKIIKLCSRLKIDKLYVYKQYHGKGIGKYILNIGHQNNYKSICLDVWDKNLKAIEFYKKNGFKNVDKTLFQYSDNTTKYIDIIMEKIIK